MGRRGRDGGKGESEEIKRKKERGDKVQNKDDLSSWFFSPNTCLDSRWRDWKRERREIRERDGVMEKTARLIWLSFPQEWTALLSVNKTRPLTGFNDAYRHTRTHQYWDTHTCTAVAFIWDFCTSDTNRMLTVSSNFFYYTINVKLGFYCISECIMCTYYIMRWFTHQI